MQISTKFTVIRGIQPTGYFLKFWAISIYKPVASSDSIQILHQYSLNSRNYYFIASLLFYDFN